VEETIARLVQGFIAFGLAYTIALWIALVLWTWRDISARSDNPFVQLLSTLVVLLFFAPGAVIYLMLRPRETLDEAYQRSVAEEYLVQDLEEFSTCPACRRPTRDDFVYCPQCRVELRRTCTGCGKLTDLQWQSCPYCGEPGHASRRVPLVWDHASWPDQDGAPAAATTGAGDHNGLWVPSSAMMTAADGHGPNGSHEHAGTETKRSTAASVRVPDSAPHQDESDS
jgi:hypothetical protein